MPVGLGPRAPPEWERSCWSPHFTHSVLWAREKHQAETTDSEDLEADVLQGYPVGLVLCVCVVFF